MNKEKIKQDIELLKTKYNKSKNSSERNYIINTIKNYIEDIYLNNEFKGKDRLKGLLDSLDGIDKQGLVYEYNLPQNLNELKTIVTDSINSSPLHLKKMELNNTAMVNFADQTET